MSPLSTVSKIVFRQMAIFFLKKIRFFDKILHRPLFGPIGTWFWSSRMIENGFLIRMVPLWCPYLKINDVSWPNNMYVMDIHIWISIYGYPYMDVVWSWNIIYFEIRTPEWYHPNQKTIFYHSRWSKPGPNRSLWRFIEDFIEISNFSTKNQKKKIIFLLFGDVF